MNPVFEFIDMPAGRIPANLLGISSVPDASSLCGIGLPHENLHAVIGDIEEHGILPEHEPSVHRDLIGLVWNRRGIHRRPGEMILLAPLQNDPHHQRCGK